MKKNQPTYCPGQQMSDAEFEKLRLLIYGQCGIKLPPVKKVMLRSRLSKRLRVLGLENFTDYFNYLNTTEGQSEELQPMIDVVTTNKTDFFREPHHFDYLRQEALPEIIKKQRYQGEKQIRIWSSACSTGEEPYTIAMEVNEFLESQGLNSNFQVMATDICTDVLNKARLAIYRHNDVEPVPLPLRQKYLTRSKDPKCDQVRITPGLRTKVRFQSFNLIKDRFPFSEPMDIIFCRNVLIYFDRQTQEKVINRLCSQLKNGGILILGHSETIQQFHVPLQQIKATIYRKMARMTKIGL